ncbi:GNAT family N-acetyltransferase [Streptomyces sp. 3MP-14]|uniref:GNAT family N-acetyltransferase n=1 Tax=Streptomyces mimosae TaxID=2586635 RepID=A0A5N6A4R9_9ACTN|nr:MULTISPECIES: GNAT family N-acetyltransferase [Streptomyces]KAB8163784.1 GNAT family N-acetyltransferase [Streptomyces mimosae]KAB8175227.1 GNAT family N-acetyltransferase [Streptomyces sp. 3MP-14]
MRVRSAEHRDLPLLREIERAAGEPFRALGMAEIADDEPPGEGELSRRLRAGLAWVAVDERDLPVGYLIAEWVDGEAHVAQVSVHPDHARRRIGRALLERLADHARERGSPALTLTTFAEVPWNAPYYRRCGFAELAPEELGPELRAVRRREAELGLDRWPRVAMRRVLAGDAG